ncbi:NAD(P)H-dependent amine dehydrogenase family protein [Sphingosinicella terrae]|uniref:NAD(P)H-dependent amine dehydrogenase family protein n=1 Tax=Sphingosinicella terrae TaxID=2172047 RepID=UPI0025466836|nr:hypothetical protein [Sphingosinicella terrae]
MGRTALRRIIDEPSLQLVGMHVYSPAKQGLDAGEIAKRPETGVKATSDIQSILETEADVVLHTPRLTLPYEAMAEEVIQLLQSGKNVVSTAGFHWPQAHGSDYSERLQAAAIKGGVTLAGVGVSPGLVVERLTLSATVLCAQIDRIDVQETVDASAMTSPDFVFGLMGMGSDPADRDIRRGPLADLYATLFSEVFHFVANEMETEVGTIEPDHELTLAPHEIRLPAGMIAPGQVAATLWRWTTRLRNGVEFALAIRWTADPRLHGNDSTGHWTMSITGRPNVRLTLDISEGDPTAPPSRALTDATVAVAVRAIPDVIAAPPGLFAFRPTSAWQRRIG